ncbi:MAG TPA: hypothetical protein VK490_03645 [Gaiellaceae bacterium]|jgi:hypothetical protein|nr:hypothetical protein [Gaiellaceae bacterium]
MRRPGIRSLAGGAAGLAAGVIGGVALTSVSAAGPTPVSRPPALIDAAHVPKVLTLPGERVRLRYAIVCTPRDDGLPCDGSGTVYVRAGRSGPYRPLPLLRGDDSSDGRYFVDLPAPLASSADGFSYYAVLRDDTTGASISLPAGGADAPQVSVPLRDARLVALGRRVFGGVRNPDARVAEAGWGSGPHDLGLAGSRGLGFSGPSSFDVERDGSVDVLDSVNGRVSRWAHGRREIVPLGAPAELADFAVDSDGSFDVLGADGTLRRYDSNGKSKWAQKLAERTWAKLEHGASGPVVLQQPSEQWMPAADDGAPLSRVEQAHAAHVGKQLANGHELLVERVGDDELRLAEARGAAPVRGWRITSDTPLGDVQLAESQGNRIVVVTRAYTDDQDEFEVLVLDGGGLVAEFAVASDSWTETAPLARFRLVGNGLYRLHTTPSGAFVDRFDLEVPQ